MQQIMKRVSYIFIIALLVMQTTVGSSPIFASTSMLFSESNKEILTSVSLYAGTGDYNYKNGAALDATFRTPQGIATLADGTVLIADKDNHVIRQVKDGQVSTFAGMTLERNAAGLPIGGWNDGDKATAFFMSPTGIATDAQGNVYIADQENHSIRKISQDGIVSTIAGDGILGLVDGNGMSARFYNPQDIAVALDGTLYVADTLNHVIRRITVDGQVTTLNAPSERAIEIVGGYVVLAGDFADGKLSEAKFNEPSSIAIDNKGNLYVSDTGNHVIRYIDLAKGTVSTVAGLPILAENELYGEGGYADGESLQARFYSPKGIAFTEEQGLVITDSSNHAVRYLLNGQVSTIAGVPTQFGHVDGINGHNLLHHPSDVAVLQDGSLLITDSYNNKIRKLDFYHLPSNLPENKQIKVVLDQQVIHFDTKPEIVNGRTMVPVRALSEQMGYEVVYEHSEQTIELSKGKINIKMRVGSRVISIENTAEDTKQLREMEMDVAPFVKGERTYVPIRFFSEVFGMDVEWDSHTNTVIIREIKEPVEKLLATDQSSRAATLEQIKGIIWINRAGGTLTYRAYEGVILQQGDQITTEANSSALLKTTDRNDELTIDENTTLTISNLSKTAQSMQTSFNIWSGFIFASVTSLEDSNDTFKIYAPNGVSNVRGTNLFVGVDPNSGNTLIGLFSGIVNYFPSNNRGSSGMNLYPSQIVNASDPTGQPGQMSNATLDELLKNSSLPVINSIINNLNKINEENNAKRNGSVGSDVTNPNLVSQNLNIMSFALLEQLYKSNKITQEHYNKKLSELKNANSQVNSNLILTDEQKKANEEAKRLAEQLAEQRRLQDEGNKRANEALLAKLRAEQLLKQQENLRAAEEARKKAEELFKQQLLDAEKQRFEQRKLELEQQRKQLEAAQRPAPVVPNLPELPPTPVNRAPIVNNPISDKEVTTETPIEMNISEVFSDPDGDILTYTVVSSNPEIEAIIEGELVIIKPMVMGSTTITITANDGKGGKAEVSFQFGLYGVIQDIRAEKSTDFINLIWDLYGGYEEEELEYRIYLDGEFVDSTRSNQLRIEELEPNTSYSLRVEALYEGDIIAVGDYEVTTYELVD